jgi:hypothetical protein
MGFFSDIEGCMNLTFTLLPGFIFLDRFFLLGLVYVVGDGLSTTFGGMFVEQ